MNLFLCLYIFMLEFAFVIVLARYKDYGGHPDHIASSTRLEEVGGSNSSKEAGKCPECQGSRLDQNTVAKIFISFEGRVAGGLEGTKN